MTKHAEGTCATCKYFRKVETVQFGGECHRYAPRSGFYQTLLAQCGTSIEDNMAAKVVWPEVYDNDGCGEWERER
jgi:hypothetical protein